MSSFSAKINNGGTLTGVIDGRVLTVDSAHFNYNKLYQAFKDGDADSFLDLFDAINNVTAQVSAKSGGKAELVGEVINYDGKPLHNEMTRRMIEILRSGEDISYLLLFIDNLMQNPSKRAIDESWAFLSHKNLPITTDGCFLAYKCVRENYLDKHSGTYDNRPGAVLEMARNAVDDNCNRTCSYGFHCGSLEYSGPQGAFWQTGDKVLIVKVNPKDIVSIPADHSAQKLRTCRYEVVDEYRGPLNKPVYSGAGVNDDDYDDTEYNYDDEWESADIYLDTSDLEEGDLIEFDYDKSGVVERRHGEVEDLNYDNGMVNIKLAPPEVNSGQFRNFRISKMDNVLLKN